MKWLALPLLLLAGCPDPEKPYDPTAGTGPNPPPGGPPPGAPGEGAAAAPGSGGTIPKLSVTPGQGVEVSGSFTYTGSAKGTRRVDFFQVDNDGKPMVLHALALEADGPWKTELPKGLGPVLVLAFLDESGNGPDAKEPAAWRSDLTVADTPITGIELAPADGAQNPYAIGAAPQPPTVSAGQPAGGGVAPPAVRADPAAPGAPEGSPPGEAPTPEGAAPAGTPPAPAAPG